MDPTDRGEAAPPERARALRAVAEDRPLRAAAAIDELLALVADHEGAPREDAGAALNEIGKHDPASLGAWAGGLADLAGTDDDRVAAVGLRGLAQLAAVDPGAVEPAADAAIAGLEADDRTARAAALSILGDLGADDPAVVAPADGRIAGALDDPAPAVRAAAVMAAGRVLGTDPSALPRTRERLLAPLEGDDREVGWALLYVAMQHPGALPDRALSDLGGDDVVGALAGTAEGGGR